MDTYQVEAESSTYFLRIYRHGWRTRAEIEAEVDMLLHLRSEGLSVSYPLERTDGTHLTRISAPEGVRYAIAPAMMLNCLDGVKLLPLEFSRESLHVLTPKP